MGRALGAGESGISAAGDAGGVADWTPRDDREPLVKRGKVALGQAVRYGRRSLGVSQDTFGIHAGVSQPVISRLETGRLNGVRSIQTQYCDDSRRNSLVAFRLKGT